MRILFALRRQGDHQRWGDRLRQAHRSPSTCQWLAVGTNPARAGISFASRHRVARALLGSGRVRHRRSPAYKEGPAQAAMVNCPCLRCPEGMRMAPAAGSRRPEPQVLATAT